MTGAVRRGRRVRQAFSATLLAQGQKKRGYLGERPNKRHGGARGFGGGVFPLENRPETPVERRVLAPLARRETGVFLPIHPV